MWTNGLSRRGRRMSLELTLPFAAGLGQPGGPPVPPSHHHHHHHHQHLHPHSNSHSQPGSASSSSSSSALTIKDPRHHHQDFFLSYQGTHPLILQSSTTATTS